MTKRGRQKGISTTEITPKQKKAVDLFRDQNNPGTFGHKTNSYEKAGYKCKSRNTAAAAAVKLFQSETVLKYVQQLEYNEKISAKKSQEITEITAEKARNDLLEYLNECKNKGDLTNWGAAIRLQLQITGQLNDKVVFSIEDSRKLNESHRKQAQRIASIINNQRMLQQSPAQLPASLPPIDAQFTEQPDTPGMVSVDNTTDDADDAPDDKTREDKDL